MIIDGTLGALLIIKIKRAPPLNILTGYDIFNTRVHRYTLWGSDMI